MTQAFACFGMGYFLCEGAALNLPQGTISLDPLPKYPRISLRYSTQPVVNAEMQAVQGGARERTKRYVTERQRRNAPHIYVYINF